MVLHPMVVVTRGETVEDCVDRLNAILRYSHIVSVTNTELTADEEGYILLASVLTPDGEGDY